MMMLLLLLRFALLLPSVTLITFAVVGIILELTYPTKGEPCS